MKKKLSNRLGTRDWSKGFVRKVIDNEPKHKPRLSLLCGTCHNRAHKHGPIFNIPFNEEGLSPKFSK